MALCLASVRQLIKLFCKNRRNSFKPGVRKNIYIETPVPVVARPKAWVCTRSPAEIVGSNPTCDMDVCLL